ncbi:MAG: hypothetical protein P8179_25480 [Candidatus Thiodiazotropha sp.]
MYFILDQHFHHVAYAGFAFVLQSAFGQGGVGVFEHLLVFVQTLFGLTGGEPAGGAGGDDLLAGVVLLGQGDVPR